MKKFLKKKLGNEKGMTLIELLAVIVILAIIAAIAIPAIGNIIENSRVGAIKSDGQNALQAAELLLIDDPDFLTAASNTNNEIVLTDLVSDYLDDEASFENASSFSITKNGTTGQLELSTVGTDGSVQVDFNNADKSDINALKNNDPKGSSTEGAATVLAR